jgi:AraC family transcriptional regulator
MRAHTARDDDRQGRRGPRLAPWQLRRVEDHIAAHAGSGITVTDLAAVCRLSRSHFTRAFRNSTGETPRQWLTNYRLRRAQTLLHGRAAIADIAIECGFADQSHLTRTFTRALGTSPGAFRRLRTQEPACAAT